MDSEYLKAAVGGVLSKGIAETCHAKPDDPIEYLAQYLLKSVADQAAGKKLAAEVADAERAALRREVKAQRCTELDFEEEQVWVRYFTQAEARPAAPEVVELDVGSIGERVCVKRSTLMLCAESALARSDRSIYRSSCSRRQRHSSAAVH